MHFFKGEAHQYEAQVFNARRNKVHHFPSPVRISVLGVNLPDMPVPLEGGMMCRDKTYLHASHACRATMCFASGKELDTMVSGSIEQQASTVSARGSAVCV